MWPFKRRAEAFTVILHRALVKDINGDQLSIDEVWAMDTYFPEGFTFMTEEEYRRRVSHGDFKGVKGGIVSVTRNRANIHTRVGVRTT